MKLVQIGLITLLLLNLFSCKKEEEEIFFDNTIQTLEIVNISPTEATLQGKITRIGSYGIEEYGFVWGTSPNPDISSSSKGSAGTRKHFGNFQYNINELVAGTTYYVKAYISSSNGIVYGEEVSFTTGAPVITNFEPKEGSAGNELVITGTNFIEDISVKLGGVEASITSIKDDSITCTVPEGVAFGEVEVSLSIGEKTTTAGENFYALKGIWEEKAGFLSDGRYGGIAFGMNGKGYFGLGTNAYGRSLSYKDLWEYDPVDNTWTQKQDFPGDSKRYAVSFEIDGKIYVGTGQGLDYKKDFWKYDPVADEWTALADFPGEARLLATAFVIDGKGYVGMGEAETGVTGNFWKYDPTTDTWQSIPRFPGKSRAAAMSFVINGEGYVGLGYSNEELFRDIWKYNPNTNTWIQQEDFLGEARSYSRGFALNNKGYVAFGYTREESKTDIWEYDVTVDNWIKVSKVANFRESDAAFGAGDPFPVFFIDNQPYFVFSYINSYQSVYENYLQMLTLN